MIVFSDINPRVFELYWSHHPEFCDGIEIMNINSYNANYPYIGELNPDIDFISKEALLEDGSPQFEEEYFNYLIEGPGFIPFMSSIVHPEFTRGTNLHLYEIERTQYKDSIIESISNLLSSRYGMVSNIVSDPDDIPFINRDVSLSITGLITITQDIERFVAMTPSRWRENFVTH